MSDAETALAHLLPRLETETRKLGGAQPPLPMSDDAFDPIGDKLARAGRLLGAHEPRVEAARARLDRALAMNQALRQARIAETRMATGQFKGEALPALRLKAAAVAAAARPDARMLRCVVSSPDWREESVIEWTDSTRTAWRHRVTRWVTAQAAVKDSECRLLTLHLAQDRRADGTWGDLYGHVMHSDPMLEQNVAP